MRWKMAALILLSLGILSSCEKGTALKGIEPAFGNVSGNDTVVIFGNGFTPGMTVQFGKRQARSVVIESQTKLIIKTPAGVEGKVDVIVTRDDGKTFVLRDGFTYQRDVSGG